MTTLNTLDILDVLKAAESLGSTDTLLGKLFALSIPYHDVLTFSQTHKVSLALALQVLVVAALLGSDEAPAQPLIDPRWTRQQVTSIKCKKSNSGNITWLCSLDSGKELYIRQGNKDLWIAAGYGIEKMKIGDEWDADITVYTMPGNSGFLDCQRVEAEGTLAAPAVDPVIERRNEVAETAQSWLSVDRDFFFLDTETTGKGVGDEVIEIAIVDARGDLILNTRVRPTVHITPEAQTIHHISAADLADAPLITEINVMGMTLLDWLRFHNVVTYNGSFDQERIKQSYINQGVYEEVDFDFNCAQKLYAKWHGERHNKTGDWKYVKLSEACKQMGLPAPDHSALGDALAVCALVRALALYNDNTPF